MRQKIKPRWTTEETDAILKMPNGLTPAEVEQIREFADRVSDNTSLTSNDLFSLLIGLRGIYHAKTWCPEPVLEQLVKGTKLAFKAMQPLFRDLSDEDKAFIDHLIHNYPLQ